jgi:hypothetical protein
MIQATVPAFFVAFTTLRQLVLDNPILGVTM